MDENSFQSLANSMIKEIGEDGTREGLLKTPQRYEESIKYLTQGYKRDVHKELEGSIFKADTRDMVVIRDIEFYSLCEHHILPFFGICNIGYIPKNKILGFSKFAHIIEIFSRRLQIQERLTKEIANAIHNELDTLGVGVVIKAKHLCMMMRGVEKQNSEMITSVMLGSFREKSDTRNEFLRLLE